GHAPRPVRGLDFELFLSRPGQRIKLGTARVLGLAPLRVQPAGALQPLQSSQQRPRIDPEYALRDLFHAPGDAEPVHGLKTESLEDQDIQRALDDISVRVVHGSFMTLSRFILIVKMWWSRSAISN